MIIISAILLFSITIFLVFYSTHISMNKNREYIYGYANFKTFLKEFNKKTWIREARWPYSYFTKEYDSNKIHASIIQFDNKGMILYPLSYIRFSIWNYLNRYKKSNTMNIVKW